MIYCVCDNGFKRKYMNLSFNKKDSYMYDLNII
jgi:hypothetical protein